jgi:Holliday junction DNA helicase RuvB
MSEDRDLLDSRPDIDDVTSETALRPETLQGFIGQDRVSAQLDLLLKAAISRKLPADHILLAGPPGLGKTTLAMIIAREMQAPLRVTSGPAIQHAGDLASILSSLTEGEIFFIDEIHRMSRTAQEMLYLAMEDFRVDIIVGKGAGATAIPLELPRFTLIGATTRSGTLPNPLRDRFGFTAQLEFYNNNDLEKIISRSADLLEVKIDDEALTLLASRSRGTPRVANRLLRRVRDYGEVNQVSVLNVDSVATALELYGVDPIGLDHLDNEFMKALMRNFSGGPTGISTIAMAIGEEVDSLESLCEPYLLRIGFLARTPRGRVATSRAYEHFGLEIPSHLALTQGANSHDVGEDEVLF